MSEYVYILQVREFIKSEEPIYKIGKTKQNNLCRFYNYPKNSVLIMQSLCIDCDNAEKQIISLFNTKYKKRKDIGNEYYEGNFITMMSDIYKIIEKQFEDIVKNNFKIKYKEIEVDNKINNDKIIKKIEVKKQNEVKLEKNINNICQNCNKDFKYKSIYIRHINSKRKCKSKKIQDNKKEQEKEQQDTEKKNIINDKLIEFFKILFSNNSTNNIPNNIQNINDTNKDKKKHKCNYCSKAYTNRPNLSRHKKKCIGLNLKINEYYNKPYEENDNKNLFTIKDKALKLKETKKINNFDSLLNNE